MKQLERDVYCDRCGKLMTFNRIFYKGGTYCVKCGEAVEQERLQLTDIDLLYAQELRKHKLSM